MESTHDTGDQPRISRTAFHVLVAIGPEERHGYGIMQEVARITDGATRLGPGGVYTTIRRLLDDGFIEESDQRPDEELDDQRRRYYRLTGLGRSVVAAEVARLEKLVGAARPWAHESVG
jgi:DNA-binding PadR family transcriptional regulator